MKYPFILSVIFLMNNITGFTQQKTSPGLRDLTWLIGTWQTEKKNGLLTESWQQPMTAHLMKAVISKNFRRKKIT